MFPIDHHNFGVNLTQNERDMADHHQRLRFQQRVAKVVQPLRSIPVVGTSVFARPVVTVTNSILPPSPHLIAPQRTWKPLRLSCEQPVSIVSDFR